MEWFQAKDGGSSSKVGFTGVGAKKLRLTCWMAHLQGHLNTWNISR